MTNEEIARFFNTTRPFIQGNPDLRDPQVEGWFRTRQHFRNISGHAILQIPVGCGKTGLMALLPFETAQGRVLVIAPNHPNLSVAAIFQPFRSLSPHVQFIVRVRRVIHQSNPQHPDNRGVAVSHVGLNIDRHWEDCRLIDQEDQELIQGWLEAGDAALTRRPSGFPAKIQAWPGLKVWRWMGASSMQSKEPPSHRPPIMSTNRGGC